MGTAEMEEANNNQGDTINKSIRKNLRQVFPVILLRHRLVHILMGKHFQDERQVVRVEKKLSHVFKLQDICDTVRKALGPEECQTYEIS